MKKVTEKYLTEKVFKETFKSFEERFGAFEDRFESSARATAKSFADNAEVMAVMLTQLKNLNEITANHTGILVTMLKEIKTIHQDNKNFRADISSLNTDGISYGRKIENLTVRVEKLELKL